MGRSGEELEAVQRFEAMVLCLTRLRPAINCWVTTRHPTTRPSTTCDGRRGRAPPAVQHGQRAGTAALRRVPDRSSATEARRHRLGEGAEDNSLNLVSSLGMLGMKTARRTSDWIAACPPRRAAASAASEAAVLSESKETVLVSCTISSRAAASDCCNTHGKL